MNSMGGTSLWCFCTGALTECEDSHDYFNGEDEEEEYSEGVHASVLGLFGVVEFHHDRDGVEHDEHSDLPPRRSQ